MRAMVAHAARSSAVVASRWRVCSCGRRLQRAGFPEGFARVLPRTIAARAGADEFYLVVDKNRFELPACRSRGKDMYLEHERHKEVVRPRYKSLHSDKTFKSEYYGQAHGQQGPGQDPGGRGRVPGGVLRRPAVRRVSGRRDGRQGALRARAGCHRAPAHERDEAEMEGARALRARRRAGAQPRSRRFRGRRPAADAGRRALRAYFSKQRAGSRRAVASRRCSTRCGALAERKQAQARVRWLVCLRDGVLRGGGEPAADPRGGPGAAAAQARPGVTGGSREDRRQPSARFGVKRRKRKKQMCGCVCVEWLFRRVVA